MIDELLGRAALKERIADLEEERDSLAAQLEAESDRRAEAARKRQEAEERVNRLEDRITALEDRLDRTTDDDERALRGESRVRPARATALLNRLDSFVTGPEGALTAGVGEELPEPVASAFGDRAGLVRRVAPAVVYTDDAGLVSAAIRPPLQPEPFHEWSDGFRTDEAWVRPTGRTLFALVRSDTFVAGVYEADERVAFDRFASDVTAEHDKGGFSQARFERRRDEEIADHVGRADDRLDALRAEHDPERTIVVGERSVTDALADHASHVASADATGDDEDALERAFRDFWTTHVFLV